MTYQRTPALGRTNLGLAKLAGLVRGRAWCSAVIRMMVVLVLPSLLVATEGSAQPNANPIQQGADVVLNDGLPRELKGLEVTQNLGDKVSKDLALIDSQGREVQMGKYLDGKRPLILTLNYSNCPMLCNVQLNQLAQSLEKTELKIGDDYQLLSVSIDPTETNERLTETKARYVEQVPSHPGATEAWAFCRSTKPVIDQLVDEVGFAYKYNAMAKEYAHPAMLAFISPDGVITRYSLGVAFPSDQMKLALVEAGQGRVGGVIDQFVLWCYDFDPSANSYVPQAWRIMQAGGFFTVCVLGLALLPYWLGRKGSPKKRPVVEPPTDSPDGPPASLKPTQWHLS